MAPDQTLQTKPHLHHHDLVTEYLINRLYPSRLLILQTQVATLNNILIFNKSLGVHVLYFNDNLL